MKSITYKVFEDKCFYLTRQTLFNWFINRDRRTSIKLYLYHINLTEPTVKTKQVMLSVYAPPLQACTSAAVTGTDEAPPPAAAADGDGLFKAIMLEEISLPLHLHLPASAVGEFWQPAGGGAGGYGKHGGGQC